MVGHAVVSVVADISELQRIAVDAAHRRAGLATSLLEEAVGLARSEGADRLLLEVREDNAGAIAFYVARGFVEIDRRPRYFRDGGTAVVMSRNIQPTGAGMMTTMSDGPLVLGIETSCDETGVGIVRGSTLLADAVASSVDEHARFGGVVPEVASRAHLEAMVPTIERACETAGVEPTTSMRSP